jgi:membrane-bound lytic murein transglycosylase F
VELWYTPGMTTGWNNCPRRFHSGVGIILACLILQGTFLSCGPNDGSRSLRDIKSSGRLVVITRNAPTTYYEDRDGSMTGFEYEMVMSFAGWLGVEPEFIIIDAVSGILEAVANADGDLAAAGLTDTKGRSGDYQVGPAYQTVTPASQKNIRPEGA